MADPVTIIAIVGGAVGTVGGVSGLAALVTAVVTLRRERREHTLTIWDSFERQIKSAEARGDKPEVVRLRLEQEAQHEAWRAQQRLEKVAPREISAASAGPSLTEEEVERLKRLLAEAQPLSPALLSAEEYLLRGNAYYGAGQYPEALADYNRALELRPDDPVMLNNRGAALHFLGHYEQALADYNRSLELRPDHPATLNNRGVTLGHMARYEEALADFNRALQLRPDYARAYYNRACLFAIQGKPDEAIDDLRRAIAGDPKHRQEARRDPDFDGIRDDARFRALVGDEPPPEVGASP